MTFEHPTTEQVPQLLSLWKEAFGEWNGFWETFLETGFAPDRCRCAVEDGMIAAALTWLDCRCQGQKLAYLYAVVTHPGHRGKSLCRRLLADTHDVLQARGYAAALLVPADPALRAMYEKLDYHICTFVEEFSSRAEGTPVPLRAVGAAEFALLRRTYLPEAGVLQENENLAFLSRQAQFYAGEDFLLTAWVENGTLTAMELLGNKTAAPGILLTLGAASGRFRSPGRSIPFAMQHSLRDNAVTPGYFGFAFD